MSCKRSYDEMVGGQEVSSEEDVPGLMPVESCSSDEECKRRHISQEAVLDSDERLSNATLTATEEYGWSDAELDDNKESIMQLPEMEEGPPSTQPPRQQPCCSNMPFIAASGHNLQVVVKVEPKQSSDFEGLPLPTAQEPFNEPEDKKEDLLPSLPHSAENVNIVVKKEPNATRDFEAVVDWPHQPPVQGPDNNKQVVANISQAAENPELVPNNQADNDSDVEVVAVIPPKDSPAASQYDSDDIQIIGYESPRRVQVGNDPFLPALQLSSSDEDYLPDLPTLHQNQMGDRLVQAQYDALFEGKSFTYNCFVCVNFDR